MNVYVEFQQHCLLTKSRRGALYKICDKAHLQPKSITYNTSKYSEMPIKQTI